MRFRAVVFDMDGTLVDTLRDIADTMNQILAANGFNVFPLEDYRKMVGEGIEALVKKALPEEKRNDPDLVRRMVDAYGALYAVSWEHNSRLYFGIRELLDRLELMDIPKAIFSNKDELFVCRMTEKLLSKWSFSMVVGKGGKFPPKPDPEAVSFFTRSKGIKPEACLYLGDSGIDMQTAKNGGCYAAGALWGFRDEAELRANGADRIVKIPLELLDSF